VTYLYCYHFPGLEFIHLPGRVEGWHSHGRGDGWKIMLQLMTGNIVISEVDALMCRTKQGRKPGALWGVSWQAQVPHKLRLLLPSSNVYNSFLDNTRPRSFTRI